MRRLATSSSGTLLATAVLCCAASSVVGRSSARADSGEAPAVCARCETSSAACEQNCEKYRPIAARLMQEAARHAEAGRIHSARNLAQRAAKFPVRWSTEEQSPEQFLVAISPTQQHRAAPVARIARRPVRTIPQPASPPTIEPTAAESPFWSLESENQHIQSRAITRSQGAPPTPVAKPVPYSLPEPELSVAGGLESPRPIAAGEFGTIVDQPASPMPLVDTGEERSDESPASQESDIGGVETVVIQPASAADNVDDRGIASINSIVPRPIDANHFAQPQAVPVRAASKFEQAASSPRRRTQSQSERPSLVKELWSRYQDYTNRGSVRISDFE